MRRLLLALALLTQVACGTIANGPMQRVDVDSFPAGAEVRLDECGPFATKKPVTTPARVWVHRHASACRITLTMPGHEPKTTTLKRRVAFETYGEALVNACSGDIRACNSFTDLFVTGTLWAVFLVPSAVVDSATGGLFEQEPNIVTVRFDEK